MRSLEDRNNVVWLVRASHAKKKKAAGQATKVIPSSTRPEGGAVATVEVSHPVQQVGES